MAAAALTPTLVQKTYLPSTQSYGTTAPLRVVRYFIKVTKVTQNDWIVTDTYTPGGSIVGMDGVTIDSSSNGVQEAPTFTYSGTTLILPSATVGTTYLEVLVALT